MLDPAEANRQAQAHLKNALELVGRPVGKEELMYMWDNQITALDNFLADTEAVQDPDFKKIRGELRDAKKKLTDAVTKFEADAAGEKLPDGEPSAKEWIESYLEQAGEMIELAKETLALKVKDVTQLIQWEEPLSVINGYLADSEPYQEASRDLRKARSVVRMARKDLKAHIDEMVQKWKAADRAAAVDGDDDEDE